MARVKLMDVAIARSGDKGAGSNVGVMAKSKELYEFLVKELTVERVQKHFAQINFGKVDRYEAPNLRSLNFILHDSLGGGDTQTSALADGHAVNAAMLSEHPAGAVNDVAADATAYALRSSLA